MKPVEYLDRAIKPHYPWIHRDKDTELSLWSENGEAYIAFQGSKSLTDWIYNFMFWSTLGVHSGIWKKYKIVRRDVDAFAFVVGKQFPINILGHSQGAGIGLLVYLRLKKQGYNVRAHLFGCPKIISIWRYLFEKKYCDMVFQYAVRTDIVTKLNPVCIQLGNVILLGMRQPIWKWKVSDHYPRAYRKLLEV